MKRSLCASTSMSRAAAIVALVGTFAVASTGDAAAGGSDPKDRLVGAWAVRVTLRDCATNLPLGVPFQSLGSFHEGGTLTDSTASTGFAPGQRTDGHGNWTYEGRSTFRQKIVALIAFPTSAINPPGAPGFDPSKPTVPGFNAGWQTITHTIELSDDNHFTSSGENAFYDVGGTLYRTGCSTSTAQRLN